MSTRIQDGAGAMPTVKIESNLLLTAQVLGGIVESLDLFYHRGEIVFHDHRGEMQVMTPRKFQTWISEHVITFQEYDITTGALIPCTMPLETAETILESPSFLRCVNPLEMAADEEGGGCDH